MPITYTEGVAFADKLMTAFADGFAKNNHAVTTAGFFADELAWDWSDGTKGEGKLSEIMEVMSKSWGFMVESFHPLNPVVVVDTDRSIIFITCALILNITGGLADENNPIHNQVTFVLYLDGGWGPMGWRKKIIKWEGYWDQKNPGFDDAFGKIMPKLGMGLPPPPKSPMPITVEEGEAYAADVIAAFASGFKNNNHLETMSPYIADKVTWDWTDGKGEGPKEEVLGGFAKTWGFMVDSFMFPNPTVVVDTDYSVVTIAGGLVINITGGLATENNAVHNDIAFVFTLDKNKKAAKWECLWDNNNPEMNAALAKVMAKLGAAK